MAGHGPPPKDPSQRARRNRAPEFRVLTADPVDQPALPTVDEEWPERTRQWWSMWADSPLAAEFTSTDWSELLDTALLHARYWRKPSEASTAVAGELRIRVAKFGATPEDRARLKITFAAANDAEDRSGTRQSSSRDRHAGLKLA